MTGDQLAFDLFLERPRRIAFPAVPSTVQARTPSGRRQRAYVADRRGVLRLVRTIRLKGCWL
jgi:hypothetical protein